MTSEEEAHIRAVGRWFYGIEPANVTDALGDVVAEMVHKVLEGSRAMNLVPRPTGGPPGLAWVASQGVQMWFRSHRTDRVYEAVKRSVALGYKSVYNAAQYE
jgi:hypothetical protein